MLNTDCPKTVLDTIDYKPCVPVFGKDTVFIFQAYDDANNTFVDGVNGIETESSWTALPDAVDDTKVVITPRLEEVNFNDSDDLDDSENEDGAPFAVGSGPQQVTAMIRNPSAAQYSALKSLMDDYRDISLYRVDNNGKIGSRLIGSADHAGIRISRNTFRVKNPTKGPGRVDMTKVMIQFYLPDGWFSSFDVTTPATGFDPLTEIKPS